MIQSGLTNGEIYEIVQENGYLFTGTLNSIVGISGAIGGGGYGWSSRLNGLICDNLISAKLVNYKGEIITCGNK